MNRLPKPILLTLILLLLTLPLASCANKYDTPVGTCGGYEILYEELRFQTMTYRDDHENCTEAELQEGVKQALCEQYAILKLCAEYLPTLSIDGEEIQLAVAQAMADAETSLGGKSELKNYMKELHLTESQMQKMLAITQMQIELEEAIFSGTELASFSDFFAWLEDGNCVRARRIFFPSNGNDAAALAEAEAAASLLKKGTSPDELLTAEQRQNGAECYQPEFYFRGMNGTETETAALALWSVGDVSHAVTTDGGYCILVRVEDDSETLKAYQANPALDRYRSAKLDMLIEQAASTLTVEWNEFGNKLILSDID